MMTAGVVFYAKAQEINTNQQTAQKYNLDENKLQAYQLKEQANNVADKNSSPLNDQSQENDPKIITETIPDGRIEKLVDANGNIIAEKTIKNDKVVQKILNYYYPDNKLMRRVTNKGDSSGFYAEEYYPNGKVSSQAMYLNENNKIGIEKKYDAYGTLRQEIPWVLPQNAQTTNGVQTTIRQGKVITYYPQGQVAAKFAVGKPGKTTFFDRQGFELKVIENADILKFTKEIDEEDCEGTKVHLDLDALVELYEDEGDISYNKCGFPYRENFLYEVYEKNSNKTTKITYDETGMIRRITSYMNGKKDGLEKKYDASGNLIAEVNYKYGKKQGDANGYFPTRERAFHKHYENGKVEGVLTCYFPDGKVAATFPYKDGLKDGTAVVNSPIEKEIKFSKGKILDAPEEKARQLVSVLPTLNKIDSSCENVDSKLMKLLLNIETMEYDILSVFNISIPQECADITTFKPESNTLICRAGKDKSKLTIPFSYTRGEYAVEKVYSGDNELVYEIPYMSKKRQGIARKYGKNGNVVTEIHFKENQMAETSRNYYPAGRIRDLVTIATDTPRRLLTRYQEDGTLIFSLTYKDKDKQEAYIRENNKETFIRFYKGKPDVIRENNLQTPHDFTEYSLAQGEYVRYENNKPVSGGKICSNASATTPQAKSTPAQPSYVTESITDKKENNLNQEKEYHLENAIIPSPKEKQQAQLAAKNIGPIQKPAIEQMADVVQKEKMNTPFNHMENNAEPKTEKFYYPNGNLYKTVKTRGPRTEEIKEYSKTGLMLTDTVYNKDKITIEKYFGSGEVRRKTEKSYDDNAVMAFLHREDFFDSGKPRYEISRKPDTLLFSEKVYGPAGNLKSETTQNSPLSFTTKEYNEDGSLSKEVKDNDTKSAKGVLSSVLKTEGNKNEIVEYYANGKAKTEIIFYANGEISVKGFSQSGGLEKYAHLAANGKLHIEKPSLRVIPSYRERYWVDYNNPRWIENQDKYSVKSIARLNLDTAAHILSELGMSTPEVMKQLYERY